MPLVTWLSPSLCRLSLPRLQSGGRGSIQFTPNAPGSRPRSEQELIIEDAASRQIDACDPRRTLPAANFHHVLTEVMTNHLTGGPPVSSTHTITLHTRVLNYHLAGLKIAGTHYNKHLSSG
eukprot:scaffold30812_cov75-Phaeocystis_antarctica.AAC.1